MAESLPADRLLTTSSRRVQLQTARHKIAVRCCQPGEDDSHTLTKWTKLPRRTQCEDVGASLDNSPCVSCPDYPRCGHAARASLGRGRRKIGSPREDRSNFSRARQGAP